jgi:hypothetical protein
MQAYRRGVKAGWAASCGILVVMASGCREQPAAEVTVDGTRELTTLDRAPRLFATSDERFRNARPSPLQGAPPGDWQAAPATQFRLLNYRCGPQGRGEVYVTAASGGVLENVNRWLGQFGAESIDEAGLAALRRVPMLGSEGVWVEARGTFAGGMGRPPQQDYALAGVVAAVGDRLWTLKMIGPEKTVESQKAALEAFAGSLRLAE